MTEPPIELRPATPADTDAVLELHLRSRAAYQRAVRPETELAASAAVLRGRRDSYYAAMLAAPEVDGCCAVRGDRVVGFTLAGPVSHPDPSPGTTDELYKIHVDPELWGRGIAGRLLGRCVDRWRAAGVVSARLFVWDFNERARRFYARNGWLDDGCRRPDDPRIGPYRMRGYRLTVPAPLSGADPVRPGSSPPGTVPGRG
ncbi:MULTISPECIES: GNAT family N-acetyltransferase [unclassified Plantactinospora]|uniref:GNAT family N-acetyltransferase n=1 Tax=unclassified Plantactinospora TaxID=2631981 RepID=UPI000D158CEE|nr:MULTISPECIES: GNAT family N-acetyltransferase [unclassified Plantactinospora]AVT30294.1 GNAT family N-acetyltransferase [Plantactinospora sp. BC1]AVT37095.1 GNAT family N-acetyltransferase [Plantactinospora sp. BB1]